MQEKMAHYKQLVEDYLERLYQGPDMNTRLYEATRYSLLTGGKRIRPILTLAAADLCGGDLQKALPFAAAIEMVHTYSLIHDDLPSMDDDDLRRGKPSNHIVFGVATAILAGDGLLTDAFSMIADADLSADRIAEGVRILSQAAGSGGMVFGQAIDMAYEGGSLTLRELSRLQSMKTGALFTASVELGAVAAGAGTKARKALVTYGMRLGRAFQMQDDILDVKGTEATVGKTLRSDERHNKPTFVSVLGVDDCHAQMKKLTEDALTALTAFPYDESALLRELAQSLVSRKS